MRESTIISQAPSDLIRGAAANVTAGILEVDLPAAIGIAATSEGAVVGAIPFMHLAQLIDGRSEVFGSGVDVHLFRFFLCVKGSRIWRERKIYFAKIERFLNSLILAMIS